MTSLHPFIPAAVVASSSYLVRSQSPASHRQHTLLVIDDDGSDIRWTLHINELPIELLMSIFDIAQKDTSPSLWAPVLLEVSHVCRRWRQAALQSERLWSFLPLASAVWTDICLSRCITAPLVVDVRDKAWQAGSSAADLLALVADIFYRIERLSVCIPEDSATSSRVLPELLKVLESRDAPVLNEFLLCFRRRNHRETIIRAHNLDKPLFLGHSLKSLRRATFVDAIVPFERLSLFPNLRSLELINSMVWRNMAELSRFFQAFPLLEELVFVYDQGAASVRQFQVNMTVGDQTSPRCLPMHRMKKFVYHAPPVQMARTFQLMYLPSTTSVSLTYDDDRWTQGPVNGQVNVPVAEWWGPEDEPVNALAGATTDPLAAFPILQRALRAHFVDIHEHAFPSLMVDGRELCASTISPTEDIVLPANFRMTIPYIGAQSIETMLSGLPVFLGAPSLTVKPAHPSNGNSIPGLIADEAYHLFQLFSHISELALHGRALSRFIEYYKRVGPKPAFPNLESLRIVSVNLAQDINDPEKPRLVMNDLICSLLRPGRVSEWLEYIAFERCTINEADVTLLRNGVETELNVEGAELELIGCTVVTDEMFAAEYLEDSDE